MQELTNEQLQEQLINLKARLFDAEEAVKYNGELAQGVVSKVAQIASLPEVQSFEEFYNELEKKFVEPVEE